MNRIVIGITGIRGAGKDTACGIIKKILPNALSVAIADHFKKACSETFGIKLEDLYNQNIKDTPFDKPVVLTKDKISQMLKKYKKSNVKIPKDLINREMNSIREVLQVVGTDLLRRTMGNNVHLLNTPIANVGTTIVTDIRFHNEFEYYKKNYHFLPIYIKRTKQEEKILKNTKHKSDTDFLKFRDECVLVRNDGTLEDLEQEIAKVLADFNGSWC